MPLVRAGVALALAGLDFVAVLDVDFFAMVPSANAGCPDDGEAELVINATGAGTLSRAPALYCRAPAFDYGSLELCRGELSSTFDFVPLDTVLCTCTLSAAF